MLPSSSVCGMREFLVRKCSSREIWSAPAISPQCLVPICGKAAANLPDDRERKLTWRNTARTILKESTQDKAVSTVKELNARRPWNRTVPSAPLLDLTLANDLRTAFFEA